MVFLFKLLKKINSNSICTSFNSNTSEFEFLNFLKKKSYRPVIVLDPKLIIKNQQFLSDTSLVIAFTTHCLNNQCFELDNITLTGFKGPQYLSRIGYLVPNDVLANCLEEKELSLYRQYTITSSMEQRINDYLESVMSSNVQMLNEKNEFYSSFISIRYINICESDFVKKPIEF